MKIKSHSFPKRNEIKFSLGHDNHQIGSEWNWTPYALSMRVIQSYLRLNLPTPHRSWKHKPQSHSSPRTISRYTIFASQDTSFTTREGERRAKGFPTFTSQGKDYVQPQDLPRRLVPGSERQLQPTQAGRQDFEAYFDINVGTEPETGAEEIGDEEGQGIRRRSYQSKDHMRSKQSASNSTSSPKSGSI